MVGAKTDHGGSPKLRLKTGKILHQFQQVETVDALLLRIGKGVNKINNICTGNFCF